MLDWKSYVHDKRIPKISREDYFLFIIVLDSIFIFSFQFSKLISSSSQSRTVRWKGGDNVLKKGDNIW